MRGHWRPDAGELWRIGLQRLRRNLCRTAFHCARLVWVFSQFVQPHTGRNAGWRAHRDRVVTLALAAWVRAPCVVRVEVSKFYYLVDRTFVAAPDLFAIPQTNRRRTALFRGHTIEALDNVDIVFRSDCGFALRNARGAARFAQTWRALPRPRAGRDRAIIKPRSQRRLSPARARFFARSTGSVCPNAAVRTQEQSRPCGAMTSARRRRVRVLESRRRAHATPRAHAQWRRRLCTAVLRWRPREFRALPRADSFARK